MRARPVYPLRFLGVLAAAAIVTIVLGLGRPGYAVPHAEAATAPPITEFSLPPHQVFGTGFMSIAGGPDGAVWFTGIDGCVTESNGAVVCSASNNVGHITIAGVLNEFSFSGLVYNPLNITLGPDNNLWVSGGSGTSSSIQGPAFVGKITPQGTSTPYPANGACDQPRAIAKGPDGALWLTSTSCNTETIRNVSTGGVLGGPFDFGQTGVFEGLTTGPDGALWVTNFTQIVRITTGGAFSAPFLLPSGSCAGPEITTGPDHNLWFTDECNHSIDRMTTAGVVTRYSLPSANYSPFGIVSAPDGNIWFSTGPGSIGFITPGSSTPTVFPIGIANAAAAAITVGPDNNLWFVDLGTNAIGRVTISGLSVANVDPNSGPPDGGTVVTISGTGFSTTPGGTSFSFGPNPATEVSCSTDKLCTAKSPKGTGAVDVIAQVNGFTSPVNAGDKFTYTPITLTIADPNVDVGNPVFFSGAGWNPKGGPIQIVYDDHVSPQVIKTLAATATFNDTTPPATYAHPTTAVWGCTATLRARQDGTERSVDFQTTHPEAALLTDGLIAAGVDDGTGHLNPVRQVQAEDFICGGESVGVSRQSTYVQYQLQEPLVLPGGSGAGTGFAWVQVNGAPGAPYSITFDDDAAKSRAVSPSGPGMLLRPGTSFCLGVYGGHTLAIVFSAQSGLPPRTQIFPVPAKCDQNIGVGSAKPVKSAATALHATFPQDSAFDPCRATGLPDVPTNLNGQALSGVYLHHGDLTINQPLALNNGILCVDGSLQLNLGVSGTGALLVNGGLAVSGPFALTGSNGSVSDITGNATIAGPDTTPPTTTATPVPAVNGAGWFTAPVSVSLAAVDEPVGSGVATTYYALDAATCTPGAKATCSVYGGTPIAVTNDGRHTLTYFSTDIAGNSEPLRTLAVNIDTLPPATTLSQKGSACATVVTLTAIDATSGVAYIETKLDGGVWQRHTGPLTMHGGHTLQYRAADVAGNVEAAHSFTASGSSVGTGSRCPSPFG